MIFAYFGPETMLPVTSIIATVAGIAMMFGRVAFRFSTTFFRRAATGPIRVGVLRPTLSRRSPMKGSVADSRN
ncbi:hypothetical protein ACYOEI_02890 [Singulisphaera rosea]